MSRLDDARELRDHALRLLADGEGVQISGYYVNSWKNADFEILLTTPFSGIKNIDVPYLLDIFFRHKVFSVGWSNNDELEIRAFKRGAWEAELLDLP